MGGEHNGAAGDRLHRGEREQPVLVADSDHPALRAACAAHWHHVCADDLTGIPSGYFESGVAYDPSAMSAVKRLDVLRFNGSARRGNEG
jgi:hypothetical protein